MSGGCAITQHIHYLAELQVGWLGQGETGTSIAGWEVLESHVALREGETNVLENTLYHWSDVIGSVSVQGPSLKRLERSRS